MLWSRDTFMRKHFELNAGPLSMEFSDGDIRNIRCGVVEIINRIYFAIRDQNWGTIEGDISDLSLETRSKSFMLTYHSEHHRGEIRFAWNAEIRGEESGHLSFRVSGTAISSFKRNRIGLCILHPHSAAEDTVRITHPDGSTSIGAFPRLVTPYQPFRNIQAIKHLLSGKLEADITFSGEIFEMEDQRNWTDATYKTYCTPLSLPFPVVVEAGERVVQTVDLRLGNAIGGAATKSSTAQAIQSSDSESVHVTFAEGQSQSRVLIPELGFSYGHDSAGLSEHALNRLREINPDFLNLELLLSGNEWQPLLDSAVRDSLTTKIPLHITLRLDRNARTQLSSLLRILANLQPKVKAWTILSEDSPTTSQEHLALAREQLKTGGMSGPIGGGTRAFFAELNRDHPDFDQLDFVSFTVTPQVHAFDNISIIENLDGQRAAVQSAAALSSGKPVHIGALSLRPQWNPNAAIPPKPPTPDELPVQVDPRQLGPFAAAWTLGSIKALAESGASTATYYEVEGWKGIMEKPADSPLPARFPSKSCELFPLYYMFRALLQTGSKWVLPVISTAPLNVDALAVRKGELTRVFLMNYTDSTQHVSVPGAQNAVEVTTVTFDSDQSPLPVTIQSSGPGPTVRLGPYATAVYDCRC